MIPTLFKLIFLPIHSFGLMMVLAFYCCWRRLCIDLKRIGESIEIAEPMITWAAISGIIGAKLGYLISFPSEFMHDPISVIEAGFVFHWGLIGGFLGVTYYLRKQKKDFFVFADVVAPSIALGYSIGRIGCQLSGDGDYGKVSDLPWAMSYSLGVVPTSPGVLVHPTPVYETMICLLISYLLVNVKNSFKSNGKLFGLCLILMGIERFFVEYLRIEPIVFQGFTQAQIVSALMMMVGFGFVLNRGRPVVG